MNQDLQSSAAAKHITVVVSGYATVDGEDGPSYASFRVNQAFIDRIAAVSTVCRQHNLTEARVSNGPNWGPAGVEEALRLLCAELVVLADGSFWFTDAPRDSDGAIEAQAVELSNLQSAFDAASDNDVVVLGNCDVEALRAMYAEDHEAEGATSSPGDRVAGPCGETLASLYGFERPLEPGDKVFVASEQSLATVLDVYGDGANGDHGEVRIDLCGNIQMSMLELYDSAKHAEYDATYVPIKAEWKDRYGIVKDIPVREAVGAAQSETQPESAWEPVYSRWRHGGWYVQNVNYPSGAVGCVSNNYPDGKWRIVCDERRVDLGGEGDVTFQTRDAAARAEHHIALSAHEQARSADGQADGEDDQTTQLRSDRPRG